MDLRKLAVIALAAALLVAAYFLLFPPASPDYAYTAPFLSEANTTLEAFAQHLLLAESVCIVEDLRNLENYPISRNNIMQCGIDFSGSEGLAGKELAVYALEGEACTTIEGIKPVSECYAEILSFSDDPSASIIWIERGNQSTPYGKNILVQVNETYLQGGCSARFNVPSPAPEEELPGEYGEYNENGSETQPEPQGEPAGEGESEGEPAGGEEPPENSEEPGEEPADEGYSHTFP